MFGQNPYFNITNDNLPDTVFLLNNLYIVLCVTCVSQKLINVACVQMKNKSALICANVKPKLISNVDRAANITDYTFPPLISLICRLTF